MWELNFSEKRFVQSSSLRCTGKSKLQNKRTTKVTREAGSVQSCRAKQEPERGHGVGLRRACEM